VEEEPFKQSMQRGDIYLLAHPGTEDTFSVDGFATISGISNICRCHSIRNASLNGVRIVIVADLEILFDVNSDDLMPFSLLILPNRRPGCSAACAEQAAGQDLKCFSARGLLLGYRRVSFCRGWVAPPLYSILSCISGRTTVRFVTALSIHDTRKIGSGCKFWGRSKFTRGEITPGLDRGDLHAIGNHCNNWDHQQMADQEN
jgi:hypothetical protein